MNPLINNNFSSPHDIKSLQIAMQVNRAPVHTESPASLRQKIGRETELSFGEVFRRTSNPSAGELKFSKHANERMVSRNIDLTESQLARLESGAKRAGEKGIKESLVMVDDLAFIVNVKNNMVITAVEKEDSKIFTNIDGAVIT